MSCGIGNAPASSKLNGKGSDMSQNMPNARELVNSVQHWHHKFEIAPGVVTPGSYEPQFLLNKINFPKDLASKRVLDIGCSDGFFSLAARRAGAEVVSIDYRPKNGHGFEVMEKLSGYTFDYRQMNVYDLSAKDVGQFDHVIFMGLLYHLPDMMKAMAIVRSLSRGQMYIETHCAVDLTPDIAVARYYRGEELNRDFTNFWSPNVACIRGMAHDCTFDLSRDETWGDRYFGSYTANGDAGRKRKLDVAYNLLG
jgi:tRNA (mo5U34)-methyltransferase